MAKVITTELQHSGASGANITLDSSKNVTFGGNVSVTGTLPADKLTGALPAISGASLTGISSPLSFRNKIVNGEMIINQRGDSTGKTATGFYGPDRWRTKIEGSCGTWSISQDSGPADKGFAKSILWHCTSGATLSGTNEIYTRYRIEAQDLQDTKWGTSDAEDLILSFWVKSTETGTAIIQVYHNDHSTSDAHTGYAYTINSANTWEKKTIQLVKSTSDAFDSNNGVGMTLQFYFDGGSDMKSGSLNTSYAGHNNANIMPGQTIALAGTGKKLWLTGVQLEKGTTATDFEHRSYADELQRCMRYYQMIVQGEDGDNKYFGGAGAWYAASAAYQPINLPVFMRAGPSATWSTGTGYFTLTSNGTNDSTDDPAGWYGSWAGGGALYYQGGQNNLSNGTAGHAFFVSAGETAAWIALTAEL